MTATLVALLVLAACSNAPQQPSDTIDGRSAESPHLGEDEEDFEVADTEASSEDDVTGSLTVEPGQPIPTGDAVASSATFGDMEGRWAATPADCPASPAIVVSSTEVERPGQICTVAELIAAGASSVTAALLCPAGQEGAPERELLRLALQDDALSMNIVGSEDPPATLQRCPA